MKKQPDFAKLFSVHFGTDPKKVRYELRWSSNCFHDLIFMDSLLRGAEFRVKDINIRGHRITIPLKRICWELPTVKREDHESLYGATSRLSISPVRAMEWKWDNVKMMLSDDPIEIRRVWINREDKHCHQNLPAVILGDGWRCKLTLDGYALKFFLQDTTKPSLPG